MFGFSKTRLLLQFHITGRCNLRCKHCYRTQGDVETLSFDDIKMVINQFVDLLKEYNRVHNIQKRGHVNITGGEPFIRKDIKDVLNLLYENKKYFSYAVLSNGSFIDDELISILKKTEVSFVQLSIDGDKATHDYLRAPGDYDRVFKTAAYLEKNKIRTLISFTATKENYMHIPTVAKECRKRRISKLWSDRLVPIGNGEQLCDLEITKDNLPDYINTMKKAQGNVFEKLNKKTSVTMNRALQFQNSNGLFYTCSAGDSLITVDEFGRIMPCRRMPIVCNDVFKSTLKQVYFNDETFVDLQQEFIPSECALCKYALLCKGGAKCQSYAHFGSYKKADPACPLRTEI